MQCYLYGHIDKDNFIIVCKSNKKPIDEFNRQLIIKWKGSEVSESKCEVPGLEES